MARGGARPGGGRRSAADEQETRSICIKALESRYGNLQLAVEALIKSKEPALIKFVYEHALGKPKEEIGFTGKNVTIKVNAE